MKTKFYLTIIVLLFFNSIKAQNENISPEINKINKLVNNYKTDNTKEILTTFLRAALNNISAEDKSFSLNTTLYALDSLLGHPKNNNRFLKQTSLDLKLSLGDNSKFSGFNAGFTTSIINKKDLKDKYLEKSDRLFLEKNTLVQADVKKALIRLKFSDTTTKEELDQFHAAWRKAESEGNFTEFIEDFNEIDFNKNVPNYGLSDGVYENIIDNYKNGKDPFRIAFNEIAERYSRKLLWTISPAFEYDRENNQPNYLVTTKLTKGISGSVERKPWELEVYASFRISKDTVRIDRNYDNQIGLISLGVNKILLENEKQEPKMEFKFFTQLEHQFGNNEEFNNIFTLNSTLRINLFKSVWLPITVKYNPDNGNLFGFFSIAANLSD